MAERGNARIQEVAASHASMVSQPEAVTRLILSAVEETSRSQCERMTADQDYQAAVIECLSWRTPPSTSRTAP